VDLHPRLLQLLSALGLSEDAPPPAGAVWRQLLERMSGIQEDADRARAGDGVISLDPEGRVRSVSSEATRLLGYAEAELLGEDFFAKLEARAPGIRLDATPEARLAGHRSVREARAYFWRRDGSLLTASYTLAPVRRSNGLGGAPGGTFSGALLCFRDAEAAARAEASLARWNEELDARSEAVTREREREILELGAAHARLELELGERARAEQALRSEKLLTIGRLAAGAAHEINNPLTYVLANLSLLSERLPALSGEAGAIQEATRMIDEALEGAGRVRAIVQALSTFARAGDERVGASGIDANRPIEAAAKMAAAEIAQRARLRLELVPELSRVRAHESRLAQGLFQLLCSAAREIPEGDVTGHEVRLATRREEAGAVVIELSTTGARISDESLGVTRGIVEAAGGRLERDGPKSVRVVLPAGE
jgi:PAS domain S-box-containing protein